MTTADTFQDFKKANGVVVIGYLATDDKESHEKVLSLANAMRDDFLFGITSDEALANLERVSFPSLAVYKSFDDESRVSSNLPMIAASWLLLLGSWLTSGR